MNDLAKAPSRSDNQRMLVEVADGDPYPDDHLMESLTNLGAVLVEMNGRAGARRLLAGLPDDDAQRMVCEGLIEGFRRGEIES